ncbi:LysR family transcriptional regulator [Pseudomonas sp. CBSPBW29]|uniref:LysR family transcriptional regulator n=1 Tax=Pseudomonas TaxID=286 RepID=UPI0021AD4667|nr:MULTISPECIES: LysR family transcriptional regulator [unclassified Pseudomonas]WEL42947.1 LysR family transcriptional regulator [Pseudomonas sp. CBSPBW29]WEL64016.1 LysR family transcriptional regulator [Pseudomonas sp. CBSPGW29]WEL73205.1 LysR family transcriptional regulator [Pseudomonas sp. CBSPCGW29]WEL74515.1 LysR family transcriptional regulator [Pseudomonas sp. CBSPAW29]WEL81246.1 LysR family transcriptional regulator [Pseudomonas sp. CBSPCAW29]WEL89748.1 LysR family transcriptional 
MNPFEDMRLFCQVMESGSFTAAAEHLGLSKQFVSRRLIQLEERLGVRLLNRSTRRLDVTPLGQSYYESALRLLSEVEQVEQGISGQNTDPRGTIRLSAPLSFAMAHLGSLLPLFLQRHPHVSVEVDLSDRPVDLISEGYDLVLRIGTLEDSTLIARRIASVQRVYCASPDYLTRRGTPQTPEDLAEHECLPYGHSRQVQWRFMVKGKPLVMNVSGRMRVNNGELLRDSAIAGLGITYLPTFIVAEALKDGRLVTVLEDFAPEALALSAVFPQHRQNSRPVQALIEFLREQHI